MAAHVFDLSEPGLEPISRPSITPGVSGAAVSASSGASAPLFAAQPEIYQRLQQRRSSNAPWLIGLGVGAVLIGGLVFAMSRHDRAASTSPGALHAMTQPPAATAPALTGPATASSPAALTPAPSHLKIVRASPPVMERRAETRAPVRALHRAAPVRHGIARAPETTQPIGPSVPPSLTPSAPEPVAPTNSVPAPAPAPAVPAPEPTVIAPAAPPPPAAPGGDQPAPQ